VIAADVLEGDGVVHLDVTASASWASVVSAIVAEHGRIDVLVNNAGIYDTTPLADVDEAGYRRILDVNLVGPFLGMKAVVPHMTGGGSIINVSSLNGILGTANAPAYTSSKFGLRGLTKATALELGPQGIRVNAILPGVIRTPMVADRVEPHEEGMAAAMPLRRIGEALDVAEAAVFLASDESRWITGTDLVVDGGHSATVPRLI
jgi:3alpha(or 20beta)-hydroxysteroid dehydrogenase